jgi:VIT1/CCC1 family predicted Fe2+/Mn2+ transporter
MAELTEKERTTLLEIAQDIWTYKLMQMKGYEQLIQKAQHERTRRLLESIRTNELQETNFWLEIITQLMGKDKRPLRDVVLGRRVSVMMSVLGPRGFFEWAIIAADERVADLATQAANLTDFTASEEWTRIAADERLHIERVKKEVLGMEGWEMSGGGGVRDLIFGANDGLVSILALVIGIYGAITESNPILIGGIAGAVAGAISMGAGAYLSAKSEKEVIEKESDRKGLRGNLPRDEEPQTLATYYEARGFTRRESEAIADRVASEMRTRAMYTLGEEVGLTSEESWPPIKAALSTGLSFAVASTIPVIPFAFMEVTHAVVTSIIASIACLFGVGASKAIFTRKNWIRSGIEMMAIGTLASAASFLVTSVIPI